MITIKVKDLDGEQHEVQAATGDHLMGTLREFEWGVAAVCGGMCSCATCHVYLEGDWPEQFPPADSDEFELLEFLDEYQPNSRLSCQLMLEPRHEGLELTLAPEE